MRLSSASRRPAPVSTGRAGFGSPCCDPRARPDRRDRHLARLAGLASFAGLGTCLGLFPAVAAAQPAPPPPPEVEAKHVVEPPANAGRTDGVAPGLLVGATFNVADNRSVISQAEGTGFAASLQTEGSLDVNQGAHEWRSTLNLGAGVTRTPAIEAWVKTRDALSFETIYRFHVLEWFGPFVRFGSTRSSPAAIRARPRRPPPSPIADGTTRALTGTRLHLSDPFEPMTLRQSLGAFAQPWNEERARVEARLGAGA